MVADPRPARRIIDPRAGRRKVWLEGRCRACGAGHLERHHLVPRSLGGDDVDANLIPLCLLCHDAFERSPSHRRIVGRIIRATLLPDELAYIIERKSEAFLDRYYPPRR